MLSLMTRQANLAYLRHMSIRLWISSKLQSTRIILVKTSGIGQSDTEILEHSDTLEVQTMNTEQPLKLERLDMLDFKDIIAINKFDKRGSLDAIEM